ncbi:U-scoloptoxin(19)-Tl1a-like [Aricia agestis]|uniref:U-scoloptoxin(19)-Tl1a-like n=1 Tax=Aricia agestis TaxID=91739 RepID=UPI001C20632B|nr:U-scoloptoxin(19)-Tl1a-like [Aricia agestis]
MLVYILFGLFVSACGAIDDEGIVNELACWLSGGQCMRAIDCPLPPESLQSACPAQASEGIICCHGISNKKKSCRERGGVCMERCPTRYTDRKAEDCEDYETCCIVIK